MKSSIEDNSNSIHSNKLPVPAGVRVTVNHQMARIEHRWFYWPFVVLAVFCLALDFFELLVVYLSVLPFFSGKSESWAILYPFVIIFVGLGLVINYFTLACLLNRTVIELTHDELSIRYEPMPWINEVAVRTADIKQFFCLKTKNSFMYELLVLDHRNYQRSLVGQIKSPGLAIFFEQKLEGWLKISHQPILGELFFKKPDDPTTKPGNPIKPLFPAPEGVQVTANRERGRIEYGWFSWRTIFSTIFCVLSFIIMVSPAFLYDNLFWVITFFPLGCFFLITGLGLAYYSLAGFINRTIIEMTHDELSIRSEPLPWTGGATFKTSDIQQIFYRKKFDRRSQFIYQIVVSGQNDDESTLVGSLDSEEVARFLVQKLDIWLKIAHQPVSSELKNEIIPPSSCFAHTAASPSLPHGPYGESSSGT